MHALESKRKKIKKKYEMIRCCVQWADYDYNKVVELVESAGDKV